MFVVGNKIYESEKELYEILKSANIDYFYVSVNRTWKPTASQENKGSASCYLLAVKKSESQVVVFDTINAGLLYYKGYTLYYLEKRYAR